MAGCPKPRSPSPPWSWVRFGHGNGWWLLMFCPVLGVFGSSARSLFPLWGCWSVTEGFSSIRSSGAVCVLGAIAGAAAGSKPWQGTESAGAGRASPGTPLRGSGCCAGADAVPSVQEQQLAELAAVRQVLQADLGTSIRRIADLQAALEELRSSDDSDAER